MSMANGETEGTTGLLDSDAVMLPFLDILKGASSSNMNLSTVRSLALKTFAHPEIFCGFDEFKSHSSPLLLPQGENSSQSSSPNSSLFNTLDLFSFGSLKDYTDRQQTDREYYLQLNETALAKLSQLSVLACIEQACFKGKSSIPYSILAEALGHTAEAAMQEDVGPSSTANIREVEDILIRCLYANVLKGKLCQKTRSFGWQGERLPVVLSRDVSPGEIPDLLSALRGLGQRLEESGEDLVQAQEQVTLGLEYTANYWKSVQRSVQKMENIAYEERLLKSGSGGPGGGEHSVSSSRFLGGGRIGSMFGQRGTSSAETGARRSSKRSRGGMAGNLVTDAAAGFRM
mmetsp:Transcript_70658/g.143495  ORF Transcript_70658/g.143495 Transcript_70658/m.143495 type:complete len:345 (+) Transcript_70658:235-1269(+)